MALRDRLPGIVEDALDVVFDKAESLRAQEGLKPSEVQDMFDYYDLGPQWKEWWQAGLDGLEEWE